MLSNALVCDLRSLSRLRTAGADDADGLFRTQKCEIADLEWVATIHVWVDLRNFDDDLDDDFVQSAFVAETVHILAAVVSHVCWSSSTGSDAFSHLKGAKRSSRKSSNIATTLPGGETPEFINTLRRPRRQSFAVLSFFFEFQMEIICLNAHLDGRLFEEPH
jgi:hypothetical protein